MTKEEKEIAENITNFCNFMCEENLCPSKCVFDKTGFCEDIKPLSEIKDYIEKVEANA